MQNAQIAEKPYGEEMRLRKNSDIDLTEQRRNRGAVLAESVSVLKRIVSIPIVLGTEKKTVAQSMIVRALMTNNAH